MTSKNVGSTTPTSSKSWRGGGGGAMDGAGTSRSMGTDMTGTAAGSHVHYGGVSAKTYPPPVRASSSAQHQLQQQQQQQYPQYSVITKGHRGDPTMTPGHSKHLRQSQNDLMSFVPPPPPSNVQHQQHGHAHVLAHAHSSKHHVSKQRWPSGGGGGGGGAGQSNHHSGGGGGGGRSVLVGATSALPGAGGDIENIDTCSRNPLFCLVCNNVFEDPRLLSCYHSFCAKCLDGRIGDTKVTCPLCGKVTALKEGSGPAPDLLLRFLLHSSTDIQPPCANCDNKHRVPMYYCNTCGQVLCNGCREETHRAKMFSTHDMIPVSKYSKETPKKCSIHGEQYIMFSTVQKAMLCINCYRDTAMDARLHCVDLETAYSQGCRKLERAVNSLRDLQVAVRDGITMLKNVLEELRRNSDSEKSAVNAVCQTILDALAKTQENLLRDVDCQMDSKDKVIRGQLSQLRAVLPTIKLHLTMCATISNATSKYDFLDLAYPLIDRLTAITHMGYPIRPGQSSQIKSSYKSEIARTLEPWISGTHPQVTAMMTAAATAAAVGGGGPSASTSAAASAAAQQLPKDYAHPSMNLTSVDPNFSEPTYTQYYPMSRSTVTPVMGHKQAAKQAAAAAAAAGGANTSVYAAPSSVGICAGGGGPGGAPGAATPSGRKTPSKLKSMADSLDEQFAAHCRSFTTNITELNQRLNRLKEQVQDLHRDVTTQRAGSYSAYASRAEAALREGLVLEELLNRRQAEMERIKKLFESTWNEHMRQVRIEQEVFQTQMNDLMTLRAEVKQLSAILQQLQSFLKSAGHHQGGGGGGGGGGGPGQGPGPSGGGGSGGGPGGSGSHAHGSKLHQQQQQQQHMSAAAVADVLTRAAGESGGGAGGSQMTPAALSEMMSAASISGAGKGLRGSSASSSLVGSHSSQQQQPSDLSSRSARARARLGARFSISRGSSSSVPGSGIAGGGMGPGSQQQLQMTPAHRPQQPHHKRGVLSQLIDKVRPSSSKEDRKKSSSSLLSGLHHPSTHQHQHQHQQQQHHPPPPVPIQIPQPQLQHQRQSGQLPHPTAQSVAMANLAAARAAAAAAASGGGSGRAPMYDAQVQYGTLANFPDTSAVTALRRSGSQRQKSGTSGGGATDDKSIYTRAKSFVKSKSDDERPPSKLSRESRARSIAALETESLLRSLSASTGSKEASRLVLSLYQTLLSDKDNPNAAYFRQGGMSAAAATASAVAAARQQQLENAARAAVASRQHQAAAMMGRQQYDPRYGAGSRSGDRDRGEHGGYGSDDDYQQIPFSQFEPPQQPLPQHYTTIQRAVTRSESTPLRKPVPAPPVGVGAGGPDVYQQEQMQSTSLGRSSRASKEGDRDRERSSTAQVQVFVHEEPGSSSSRTSTLAGGARQSVTISSSPPPRPPPRLARSFEEPTPSYMYGFLSPPTSLSGTGSGASSGSGGERGGPPTVHPLRKPQSCDSLISLGSNNERSSVDFDRRSVVTVRRAGSGAGGGSGLIPRQHSWEGGINVGGGAGGSLPRNGHGVHVHSPSQSLLSPDAGTSGRRRRVESNGGDIDGDDDDDDDDEFGSNRSSSPGGRRNPFDEGDVDVGGPLHKTLSFEGHEEAVRSIVAVVQETRRERSKEKSSQMQSNLQ